LSHLHRELYAVAVQELIFTTVAGVAAVCLVGFIIIPHWTAICFVGPLIIMLYFDLLGIMQFCGIDINAVTYVTIVISIGLLVDFLMHILLRYYETPGNTRVEKVQKTLQTMGASMMLGGFTTWLGVIPMAMSTTFVFTTICKSHAGQYLACLNCRIDSISHSPNVLFLCLVIAFLAMVTLGLLIGLAFLPAILSIWGPMVYISTHDLGKAKSPPIADPTTRSRSSSPHLDRLDSPSSVDSPTGTEGGDENRPVKAFPQQPLDSVATEGVDSTSWLAGVVHEASEHVPPMLDEDDEELATVVEDTA
jgi:Patched family